MGFNYNAGDVWYIFTKDNVLHVGSMSEEQWRRLGISDQHDGEFQASIDSAEKEDEVEYTTTISRRIYKRDTKLAWNALSIACYQCEYDPASQLFTSRATGNPYLEAHHLIPLYATPDMGNTSLDVIENIVALAPHWHRAIHSAEQNIVVDILTKLSLSRAVTLDKYGIGLDDLVDIYGCGKIA